MHAVDQQRGIGSLVLDRLQQRYRRAGYSAIELGFVDGIGSPRPFYERHGFVPTGRVIDGEIEARLTF
jgi:diamine N-acetyltransferase